MERKSGHTVHRSVAGEHYGCFVPVPLPPDPPLNFDSELVDLLERANRAIGRLDGVSDMVPNPELFLYQFVRKEALVSSQIEGTQSSLSDLLLFELDEVPGVPLDDVREVSNYIAAMDHGIRRLRGGFPLSLRLLREIHEKLLAGGRGANKQPGEFRTSQNWLGGTRPGNARFIPPPPEQLMECLGSMELYLHEEKPSLPVLVRAALVHVQFETIHPFLDGNGRLGRLLISLILLSAEVLRQPLLYLSLYFKSNRMEYYDQLQRVRTSGDWEGWLAFFLRGVLVTSQQAVEATRACMAMFAEDRDRIYSMGRISGSCARLHEHFQQHPLTTIADAARSTGVNRTSISNCIELLMEMGIVTELTGQQRNRVFSYDRYVTLLGEGTDPL